MRQDNATILLVLAMTIAAPLRAGEDPDVKKALAESELASALAVTVGCDGAIEADILRATPDWIRLSVGGDVAAADTRRAKIRDDAGRAVVQSLLSEEIPVYPRAAALLVIDADALGSAAPSDAEIARVLRPFGTAWIKRGGLWSSRKAPWPETIADLTHWLGDSRLSSQVPDREIGRVRSLRWHTGREKLTGSMIWAAGGVAVAEMKSVGRGVAFQPAVPSTGRQASSLPHELHDGLAGFDAFTGLQLWHRPDLRIAHNYAVTLDRQRLVVRPRSAANARRAKSQVEPAQPEYLRSLDPDTGSDLLAYDQGPDIRGDEHVLANLHEGKLIVAATGSLTVLDAATGRRLWQAKHAAQHVAKSLRDLNPVSERRGHVPESHRASQPVSERPAHVMFPAASGGRVACVIGPDIGSTAAHNGELDREILFKAAVCYDLATGEELWRWRQDKFPAAGCSYAAFVDGRYWVSVMPPQGDIRRRNANAGGGSGWYLACLNPVTGKPDWMAAHPELGPSDKFLRLFASGDTLLLCRGAQTFYAMARDTGEVIGGGRSYDSDLGGCAHPRTSARYAYQATTSIEIQPPFWTHRANLQSGRCHKGGFPALGMLLAADAGCDCDAFLRGLSAYGSDDPPPAVEPITTGGPGRPGQEQPGDAWRTALRDARRSTWSPHSIGGELREVWRTKLEPLGDAPLVLAAQWERHELADTISGPVVADGAVVVALSQRHTIVGLDPASGKVRWNHVADARVDGPVTLAGGMAVYGTAGGWVEAISIDDGRFVWRTLVAPGSRFRVENGQVESSQNQVSTRGSSSEKPTCPNCFAALPRLQRDAPSLPGCASCWATTARPCRRCGTLTTRSTSAPRGAIRCRWAPSPCPTRPATACSTSSAARRSTPNSPGSVWSRCSIRNSIG